MKVRSVIDGRMAESSTYNVQSVSEILVYWSDGPDTYYMSNYEVFIEAEQWWMTFHEAFEGKHLINDYYNTHFFEPTTEEDRQRGYTL